MQMYEVRALSEDMQTELFKEIYFAEDEDDAIERAKEQMESLKISYCFCLADAI